MSVGGLELARYTLHDLPRTFDPPPVDLPLGVDYPGLGQLVGATISAAARNQPLTVTLVWQADSTPQIAYTVFVQLIGEDGTVLAQSDAMPAGNTRPTTGWQVGEYVTDTHTLNLPEFTGTVSLIVGLYDASTPGFPRLLTASGDDYIRLPVNVNR